MKIPNTNYNITESGVITNEHDKILKHQYVKGRARLGLVINGKRKNMQIHRLIAQTFLEHKIKGKPFDVKFIDGNYRNLKLSNLSINFRKVIKL